MTNQPPSPLSELIAKLRGYGRAAIQLRDEGIDCPTLQGEDLLRWADQFDAALSAQSPQATKTLQCINCGEVNDGGFEFGTDTRGCIAGPFCSTCFHAIIDVVKADHPEPAAQSPQQEQQEKKESQSHMDSLTQSDQQAAAPTVAPDATCEHGTAWDVHCCGCHSGFLFDSSKCVCF